jgi:hypothetical protein
MSAFQMELNDYLHFYLTEDGRLCSTGQYCSGFLRVLYDTLIRLGYYGDVPVYRYQLCMAHGLDRNKVGVMIPFDPMEHGRGPSSAASPTPALTWWHTSLSPPCARTASLLLQHCLSRFFQFGIRRTPYGSSAMRPCPTSRALASMLG